MDKYTHVILDEIHERDIDIDLLMTIVREFLRVNSMTTKVILMSATFNPKPFVDYFTLNFEEKVLKPSVVQLKNDRHFKINKIYLDSIPDSRYCYSDSAPGISQQMYEVAKKIILERLGKSSKSVLVFLPGIYEIESLFAMLNSDSEMDNKAMICVLHSSMATVDQRVAFMPATKPKIVLSTNIAESSVTIDNVDCVIDFCLTKYIQRDKFSKTSISSLKLDWASQNSLKQRAGRTGRTCDGTVYRLIYRQFFNNLLECSTPEMQRCPLETVVLRVKMLDEAPVWFLAKSLSPPLEKDIRESIRILKELGGLERVDNKEMYIPHDGELTYVGRIMAALPLDVRVSKLIIVGYLFSVVDEAIIIAAGLNIKSIFSLRYQKKLDIYNDKLKWADGSGCDMIALLNAYKLWQFKGEQGHFSDYKHEIAWCDRHNLERKSLHEMRQLIREITNRLADLKLEKHSGVSWEAKEKIFILKICFAGTFIPNFFMIGSPSGGIEEDVYKTTVERDPSKTIYFKQRDKSVRAEIYEEQIKSRFVSMGICGSTKDVKVIFETGSSKIFIEFVNEESMIDDENYDNTKYEADFSTYVAGRIKPEVYKALKMRRLGIDFQILVMDELDTQFYEETNAICFEEREVFGPPKGMMTHPELCVIPSTCAEKLLGKVTHIDHCGKFYIQPSSPADKNVLQKIQTGLTFGHLVDYETVSQIKRFQFVAVDDSDETWKRAKAVGASLKDQTVTCFMFDYGETKEFPIAQVHGISKNSDHQEIFKIPERCFEASLSEIAPSCLKCARGKWTKDAIDLFRNMVENRELIVKVYSVVKEIASVELWIHDSCVNKNLIAAGFAQELEESYPKKHNHELRKSIQKSSVNHFGLVEEFASRPDTLVTKKFPPPPIDHCRRTFFLQGPLSPLETKPYNIFVNSNAMDSIDPLSVNSVLLYEDPGNTCARLLVAANATEVQNGVVLHETSCMPDLPGLPVLLALIFAPDVIIKRNDDKTRYESIQFGLGCESITREPYFSQHDCILPVNISLSDEDFRDINYLRFAMSYLLMTQPMEKLPSLSDAVKLEALTLAKQKILKILSGKRLLLPTTCASNPSGVWTTEDQSDKHEYDDENILIGGGLYRMLSRPPLLPLNDAKKAKMKKDLENAMSDVTL